MKHKNIEKLPMPEQKVKLKAPTWSRIKKHFKNVNLLYDEETQQTSNVKGLCDTHNDVLGLLDISKEIYQKVRKKGWWQFDGSVRSKKMTTTKANNKNKNKCFPSPQPSPRTCFVRES